MNTNQTDCITSQFSAQADFLTVAEQTRDCVYVAEITPAGTYFSLKLAMLLSLVAGAHEVYRLTFAVIWSSS